MWSSCHTHRRMEVGRVRLHVIVDEVRVGHQSELLGVVIEVLGRATGPWVWLSTKDPLGGGVENMLATNVKSIIQIDMVRQNKFRIGAVFWIFVGLKIFMMCIFTNSVSKRASNQKMIAWMIKWSQVLSGWSSRWLKSSEQGDKEWKARFSSSFVLTGVVIGGSKRITTWFGDRMVIDKRK